MNNVIEIKNYFHPKIGHVYNLFDGMIVYVTAIDNEKVYCKMVTSSPIFGKRPSIYHIENFSKDSYVAPLNQLFSS